MGVQGVVVHVSLVVPPSPVPLKHMWLLGIGQIQVHRCKLKILKNQKTFFETNLLYNFIVNYGVICHEKLELQVYA